MKVNLKAKLKRIRLIAIFLTILLFWVMLFATAFVVQEASHDCIGENCPICYQISVCDNIMKMLGSTLIIAILTVLSCFGNNLKVHISDILRKIVTLVILKVKLSI